MTTVTGRPHGRQTLPRLELVCGACRRRIARGADVYLVDEEWRRRYPGPQMLGLIVCKKCSFEQQWSCERPGGGFVDGHIPVPLHERTDFDAWSHVLSCATQSAAVFQDPQSAAAQGAEAYLAAKLA